MSADARTGAWARHTREAQNRRNPFPQILLPGPAEGVGTVPSSPQPVRPASVPRLARTPGLSVPFNPAFSQRLNTTAARRERV